MLELLFILVFGCALLGTFRDGWSLGLTSAIFGFSLWVIIALAYFFVSAVWSLDM